MKRNLFFIIMTIAFIVTLTPAGSAFAQAKLTFEEYQAELATWQQRETDALARIAELEAEIAAIQAEIDVLQAQDDEVWREIHEMLGLLATASTSDDVDGEQVDGEEAGAEEAQLGLEEFAAKLQDLANRIAEFGRQSPEELYQNRATLDEFQAELEELSKHPAALLTEYKEILERLFSEIESTRARMAPPPVLSYSVVRGDYLWKISAMSEHYGDGTKWMRIYSVNHDQIDDPDLIFPNQVFNVPLNIDLNQYLVEKGDFLYGIAEALYNDPFKWRELYEVNKALVEDPNYIVPNMILTVPGR